MIKKFIAVAGSSHGIVVVKPVLEDKTTPPVGAVPFVDYRDQREDCLAASREELVDEEHDDAGGDHAAEEDVLVALLSPLDEPHDGGGHADRRRDVLHLPLEALQVRLALVAQRLQHRLTLVQQVVHAAVRSLQSS